MGRVKLILEDKLRKANDHIDTLLNTTPKDFPDLESEDKYNLMENLLQEKTKNNIIHKEYQLLLTE